MSVFSIGMVSSALLEIPTGIFSDKIGRKKTILLGSISSVVFIFIYAMATSYQMLLMGAVIAGFSRSLFSGNNEALLHDSLKENGIEKNFLTTMARLAQWNNPLLELQQSLVE